MLGGEYQTMKDRSDYLKMVAESFRAPSKPKFLPKTVYNSSFDGIDDRLLLYWQTLAM
jgi:hypothetical protein